MTPVHARARATKMLEPGAAGHARYHSVMLEYAPLVYKEPFYDERKTRDQYHHQVQCRCLGVLLLYKYKYRVTQPSQHFLRIEEYEVASRAKQNF
jgi:hypothetical protein